MAELPDVSMGNVRSGGIARTDGWGAALPIVEPSGLWISGGRGAAAPRPCSSLPLHVHVHLYMHMHLSMSYSRLTQDLFQTWSRTAREQLMPRGAYWCMSGSGVDA